MSQVMVAQAPIPSLPIEAMTPEMVSSFNSLWENMSAGFSSSVRRIKIRKADFLLTEGQTETEIPPHQMLVVVLGVAPCNHAVWYSREFTPGQESGPPDLVWLRRTDNDFPEALPKEFHKKIVRNGREMWAFQVRRRIVVALANIDGVNGNILSVDTDNPCVMDLSGMSLYGKSDPKGNYYKWNGLIDLCKKYSRGNVMVSPAHFVTQIVPDPQSQVVSVVFRPMLTANGYLQYLNGEQIAQVLNAATSPQVKDMLTVREVLTMNAEAQSAPQAQPVAQPMAAQPAPQPQPVAQPAMQLNPNPPVGQMQTLNTVQNTVQTVQQPAQSSPQEMQTLLQQASASLNAAPAAAPVQTASAPDAVASAISNLQAQLNQ